MISISKLMTLISRFLTARVLVVVFEINEKNYASISNYDDSNAWYQNQYYKIASDLNFARVLGVTLLALKAYRHPTISTAAISCASVALIASGYYTDTQHSEDVARTNRIGAKNTSNITAEDIGFLHNQTSSVVFNKVMWRISTELLAKSAIDCLLAFNSDELTLIKHCALNIYKAQAFYHFFITNYEKLQMKQIKILSNYVPVQDNANTEDIFKYTQSIYINITPFKPQAFSMQDKATQVLSMEDATSAVSSDATQVTIEASFNTQQVTSDTSPTETEASNNIDQPPLSGDQANIEL